MKIPTFKKKLQGYISSGKIGKNFYPQKIQNLCLKHYCEINKYHFILSATEFKIKKSNLVLKGLVQKLKKFDGVIFFSIEQLDNKKFLLVRELLKAKKEIHFYNENIIIKNAKDYKNIALLKKINNFLTVSNKKLDV